MQIAIADAKAQFAELIRRAEAGEEIEVTRYGRPVAKITAPETPAKVPLFGALKDELQVPDDILEPMSEEELALWEGE